MCHKTGVNLVLIAHRRDLYHGSYDVNCVIDGKVIQESGVRGFFELVWSRH